MARSNSQTAGPSSPAPATQSQGSSSSHGGSSLPIDPTQLPSVSPGGTYSIETVGPGCKIFVQKPDLASGEMEERRAEVLSRREKFRGRVKRGEAPPEVKIEEKYEYYVHYEEFNKRLDEWVLGTRLITSREIEWPKPADQGVGGHGHGHGSGSSQKKKATPATTSRSGTSTPTKAGSTPSSKQDGLKEDLLRKAAKKAASKADSAIPSTPQPKTPLKRTASAMTTDTTDSQNAETQSIDSPMAEGSEAGTTTDADGEADADGDTVDGSNSASPSQQDADTEDGAVVAMELLGDESMDMTQDGIRPGSATAPDPLDNQKKAEPISKEAEIEKLRTSGSMTQSVSEVARVKNFDCIRMGAHEVETWYFSPYPVEYASAGVLYICEMCLSYFPSEYPLKRHRTKCKMVHPPGNEIYRHEDISFFEIDGRKQKTWCRNLCLLSKCFLDHKTLYYDVDPFLYYVMVQRDGAGCHTIGYFSKEKESAEGYNVACILTLPQHQRSGFGRLLIDFSYELSKREHKLGSPEKPLSDLGLLGYRAYWAETIVGYLLNKGDGEETSIDEVAWKTCITHSDVLHTCTSLNMLKQFQGKHYLVLNDQVLANHEKQMAKRKRRIKGENLHWIPPVFSRAQLQFGW
ncbi:unnamed protein product [Sympodiomycopsis kandeliae]